MDIYITTTKKQISCIFSVLQVFGVLLAYFDIWEIINCLLLINKRVYYDISTNINFNVIIQNCHNYCYPNVLCEFIKYANKFAIDNHLTTNQKLLLKFKKSFQISNNETDNNNNVSIRDNLDLIRILWNDFNVSEMFLLHCVSIQLKFDQYCTEIFKTISLPPTRSIKRISVSRGDCAGSGSTYENFVYIHLYQFLKDQNFGLLIFVFDLVEHYNFIQIIN